MNTNPLGHISVETFLAEYWQKKPLVIRGALPGISEVLSADELAGLACEEEALSRLVLTNADGSEWKLRFGPFSASDFKALPKYHWTLLVQEVDHFVPEVADLLDMFRFIPGWRLDDIMISYAVDGGGVGPHVDLYDVFLIQGMGTRRWQIHSAPMEHEDLVPNLPLKILKNFEPDHDWVLEPGDMLYLPPRIAHHGTAVGSGMTYSVGFRAPRQRDLVAGYFHRLAESLSEDLLYADPDLQPQANAGLIAPSAIQRMFEVVASITPDARDFEEWLGMFLTAPKDESHFGCEELEESLSVDDLLARLRNHQPLRRAEGVRFAFTESERGPVFFVNGEVLTVSDSVQPLLKELCDRRQVVVAKDMLQGLDQRGATEILGLIGKGYLYLLG